MIVHKETDQFGTVMVSTSDNYVDLLFQEDPNAIQSRLNLDSPEVPELEYVKCMCLGSSLVPRPRNILILGHGGGSLSKFYCSKFPKANIDIVDMRPSLWDISKKFFQFLPSAKTRLFIEDATKFLARAASAGDSYDLIFVDLYVDGPSNVMATEALWDPISRVLSPLGFCLANVWRFNEYEILYETLVHNLSEMFSTVARTDMLSNQCILVLSHLDPTVLDTSHLVNRTDYDTINTKIPLSRILRNTRILRK